MSESDVNEAQDTKQENDVREENDKQKSKQNKQDDDKDTEKPGESSELTTQSGLDYHDTGQGQNTGVISTGHMTDEGVDGIFDNKVSSRQSMLSRDRFQNEAENRAVSRLNQTQKENGDVHATRNSEEQVDPADAESTTSLDALQENDVTRSDKKRENNDSSPSHKDRQNDKDKPDETDVSEDKPVEPQALEDVPCETLESENVPSETHETKDVPSETLVSNVPSETLVSENVSKEDISGSKVNNETNFFSDSENKEHDVNVTQTDQNVQDEYADDEDDDDSSFISVSLILDGDDSESNSDDTYTTEREKDFKEKEQDKEDVTENRNENNDEIINPEDGTVTIKQASPNDECPQTGGTGNNEQSDHEKSEDFPQKSEGERVTDDHSKSPENNESFSEDTNEVITSDYTNYRNGSFNSELVQTLEKIDESSEHEGTLDSLPHTPDTKELPDNQTNTGSTEIGKESQSEEVFRKHGVESPEKVKLLNDKEERTDGQEKLQNEADEDNKKQSQTFDFKEDKSDPITESEQDCQTSSKDHSSFSDNKISVITNSSNTTSSDHKDDNTKGVHDNEDNDKSVNDIDDIDKDKNVNDMDDKDKNVNAMDYTDKDDKDKNDNDMDDTDKDDKDKNDNDMDDTDKDEKDKNVNNRVDNDNNDNDKDSKPNEAIEVNMSIETQDQKTDLPDTVTIDDKDVNDRNTTQVYTPLQEPPLATNQTHTNHYTYKSYDAPTKHDSDTEVTSAPTSPHHTNKPHTTRSEIHTASAGSPEPEKAETNPIHVTSSPSQSKYSEKAVMPEAENPDVNNQTESEPVVHISSDTFHPNADPATEITKQTADEVKPLSQSADNSNQENTDTVSVSNNNSSANEIKVEPMSDIHSTSINKQTEPTCSRPQSHTASSRDQENGEYENSEFVLPRPVPPMATSYTQTVLSRPNSDRSSEVNGSHVSVRVTVAQNKHPSQDDNRSEHKEDVGLIPRPLPPMATHFVKNYHTEIPLSPNLDTYNREGKVSSENSQHGGKETDSAISENRSSSENCKLNVISDTDNVQESTEVSRDVAERDNDTDSNITGPAATSSRIDIRQDAGVKQGKKKAESGRKSTTSSSGSRARTINKPTSGTQPTRRRTPSNEGDRKSIRSSISAKKTSGRAVSNTSYASQKAASRAASNTSYTSQKKRNISAERAGRTPSVKSNFSKTSRQKSPSKKDDKAISVKSLGSKTSEKLVNGVSGKEAETEIPTDNEDDAKAEPEKKAAEEPPQQVLSDTSAGPETSHDESFASSNYSKYSDERDTTDKEEPEHLIEVAPAFKPPVTESEEETDTYGEEETVSADEIPKPVEKVKEETEEETEDEEQKKRDLELEHIEEKDQPTKEPVTVKIQKHVTTIVEPQRSSRMSGRTSKGSELSGSFRYRQGLYNASRTSTRTSSRPRTTTTTTSLGKENKHKEKQKKKEKSKKEKSGSDNTVKQDSTDGRSKQKEFFKEELRRLEESLKKERSRIQRPPIKKNIPYTFNSLDPYFNIHVAKYLIEAPEEMSHVYASRETALGLCDPLEDYRMDHVDDYRDKLPGVSSKSVNRYHEMMKKEKKIKEREQRHKTQEGSTRLPKFPVVTMQADDLARRPLYFSDVPMLRKELEEKYSANAQSKIDEDYKRTRDDFYRMELDRMSEYHPSNRPLMRQAYFAYLSNTPGSRKAIKNIMKEYSNKKTAKA